MFTYSMVPEIFLRFNGANIDRCTVTKVCVLVTACMTRGPLFQRASIVRSVLRSETGSVNIQSASFLPYTYFSLDKDWLDTSMGMKIPPEFRATMKNMQGPITYDLSHIPCSDGCTSSIKVRYIFEQKIE